MFTESLDEHKTRDHNLGSWTVTYKFLGIKVLAQGAFITMTFGDIYIYVYVYAS